MNMAHAEKIIKLDNTKVYDQIEKFLTKHKYNSADTETAYRRDVEMFFKLMKKKEIQYLTIEDIQLTLDDFEDFIETLYNDTSENGERKYSNKTINRKVSAIKGCIKYLAGKKLVEDVSFLELIDSLPETSNSYGVLEASEVFRLSEIAAKERNKGNIKRLLILFALDTCIRKSALLNLTWSNFIEREDGVMVKGVDKGNKDFRHLISKEFYQELLTLKTDNSDKVFDISGRRIDDMMTRLKEKANIASERNIVFHSIRKAGVTYRYRVTGDILEAQRSAGHSNITTTQIYLENEDYGSIGAVSSAGKLDMELYKKVDQETLIKAIEMTKKDFQLILNLKIQELQRNNNE
jgi:integrase